MSEKKYEKAVAERVVFDNNDVVTTSGGHHIFLHGEL